MFATRTTAKALGLIIALVVGPASAASQPTQQSCRPFRFPVYFPVSSTALTAAADRVIRSAGERMRPCKVERIEISIRNKPGEAKRDQTRAQVVSAALSQADVPAPTVVMVRETPFQMFRRRVVVSVEMSAP